MEVKTKYDNSLTNKELVLYFKRLIGKIYKIMPMKENIDKTLEKYLDKLIYQLLGGSSLVLSDSLFVEIILNLESLRYIEDIQIHNSIVKETMSLCEKIIKKLEE
jgi:hypothetical protein